MKVSSLLVALSLATASIAAPGPKHQPKGTLLPPSVPGPAPKYSIGKRPGPFAKTSGRLFVLDGKKQYFSGRRLLCSNLTEYQIEIDRNQRLVACALEQELRYRYCIRSNCQGRNPRSLLNGFQQFFFRQDTKSFGSGVSGM